MLLLNVDSSGLGDAVWMIEMRLSGKGVEFNG